MGFNPWLPLDLWAAVAAMPIATLGPPPLSTVVAMVGGYLVSNAITRNIREMNLSRARLAAYWIALAVIYPMLAVFIVQAAK